MSIQDFFGASEPTVPESIKTHPAWFRLIDQKNWYDRKSQRCQGAYKRLKIAQVTLAVLVPAAVTLPGDLARTAASACGVLIAILEAVQQVNQYAELWVTYRGTAERLKHEQFLFLSEAGPYKGMSEKDRLVTLAERVEEQVSTEHAKWFSDTTQRVSATGAGSTPPTSPPDPSPPATP